MGFWKSFKKALGITAGAASMELMDGNPVVMDKALADQEADNLEEMKKRQEEHEAEIQKEESEQADGSQPVT